MLNCLQIFFLIIIPSTLSSLSNFSLIKSKAPLVKGLLCSGCSFSQLYNDPGFISSI